MGDLDISAMASATMVWATAATTTARGRLSPRLRPSPTTMVDTDSDTTDLATASATVAMGDTTTARGRPRPSLRLLLTPTCCTVRLRPWTRLRLWLRSWRLQDLLG